MKGEFHCHTRRSPDGTLSPAGVVEVCRRRGIDCLAVTDHNTIRGALEVRDLAGFTVIVASEIRTCEGEVFGFFLEREIPPGLTPEETADRIKVQGGLLGVPHPFDPFRRSRLRRAALRRLLDRVDFLEVCNARNLLGSSDRRAAALAVRHGLAPIAGSDAHTAGEFGAAWVDLPPFEGPAGFLRSLQAGLIHPGRSGIGVHLTSALASLQNRFGGGERAG